MVALVPSEEVDSEYDRHFKSHGRGELALIVRIALRPLLDLRYAELKSFSSIITGNNHTHSSLGGKIINLCPKDSEGEVLEFTCLEKLLKSYRRVKSAA